MSKMGRDVRVVVAVLVGMLSADGFAGQFRETAPGVLENGSLRIIAKPRIVSFPARVNQVEGAVEYGIVTPSGSVHESLLVAAIDPVELHAALLLLGVKVGASHESGGSERLNAKELALAPELTGVPVEVRVCWESAGVKQRAGIEDWIRYKPRDKAAESGPWTYTGSYFVGGQFAAAAEGALLCLVTNGAALMNNPRAGHRDDQAWEVFTERVPAKGTPVTVEVEVLKVKPTNP
jgi:hypothetical protein